MTSNITTAITAIDAEIATLTERLSQLETTKKVLLLDTDAIEEGVKASAKDRKVTAKESKPAKSSRRVVRDDDDEEDAPAPKRAKVSSKASTKSSGKSQAEKILELLAEGDTPGEVAKKLGTNVRYVYNVRGRNAE